MTVHDSAPPWWSQAVFYQVYLRSFADGNGDGVGDLAGLRARLPYLKALGVDALWVTPWYASPMADGGYDVSDHRAIDPLFGTIEEAESLLAETHEAGLRMVLDLVPNHCSEQHPWFRQATAQGPGAPARDRFWFRPGKGPDGSRPPNDWPSQFGGPAWTRITEPDGTPGPWYLHLFSRHQPDLNWNHPDVRADFAHTVRFWLERGADGFRVDAAPFPAKDPALPDVDPDAPPAQLPYQDRHHVHEIYRALRALSDSYPGNRFLIGEVHLPTTAQRDRYVRADELHCTFNFPYLTSGWRAGELRQIIADSLTGSQDVIAPTAWVLSNHDTVRHLTRFGREDSSFHMDGTFVAGPLDTHHRAGYTRARAALLLTLALPGPAFLYQGEELGLAEVDDLPLTSVHDPAGNRPNAPAQGRDGCRVPLPWSEDTPPFGFTSHDTAWLPQPASWHRLTAQRQEGDPTSMLHLYRNALAWRADHMPSLTAPLAWLDLGDDVLAFTRGAFTCVVNFGEYPIPLPHANDVHLTSSPLNNDQLPQDACAWLTQAGRSAPQQAPGSRQGPVLGREDGAAS
ncbi:glycoside hydrolase family 13 protein [Streptomyces sp. SID14478]|uniref:glycoside hydrolase family 13 protein n=1 Tax=Streptomyces sp. SID14478 TaxID=2706073 RepID=UPI0013DC3354|nr:glycoside hydrolase family 13 protein [Streptomyces sp. SID14478]NEB79522.1 glycoside hydrolase family 13 protein [Streptomyces sp. SID14478]